MEFLRLGFLMVTVVDHMCIMCVEMSICSLHWDVYWTNGGAPGLVNVCVLLWCMLRPCRALPDPINLTKKTLKRFYPCAGSRFKMAPEKSSVGKTLPKSKATELSILPVTTWKLVSTTLSSRHAHERQIKPYWLQVNPNTVQAPIGQCMAWLLFSTHALPQGDPECCLDWLIVNSHCPCGIRYVVSGGLLLSCVWIEA